jgi:hypothetical protein
MDIKKYKIEERSVSAKKFSTKNNAVMGMF